MIKLIFVVSRGDKHPVSFVVLNTNLNPRLLQKVGVLNTVICHE